MSDRETALLDRWRCERAMYHAWGSFVSETIVTGIRRVIGDDEAKLFFRIPVAWRVKDEASLLAKAFHRGKNYTDPYAEIEDKVGCRVVVLFSEEIRTVEGVLQDCSSWAATLARDFEHERARRPFEFDYQSLHYIVRAKVELRYGEVDIAPDTPCEIQVRTLLQHAYSELTHDTIYKPNVQAEPQVKRAAAKSMALIEATDDYFTQVRARITAAQAPALQLAVTADQLYREFTGLEPEPSPLNSLLIDHLKQWVRGDFEAELSAFLKEKSYLAEFIRERAPTQLLYRQPAIIVAFWTISQAPRSVPVDGPLSDDELAPLYSVLGARLPDARA